LPAISFSKQFADAVESGAKRQTIRRKRKRPTKAGDTLHLYTGMRTKACQKLRKVTCRSVTNIVIHPGLIVMLNGRSLTWIEANELARGDGFGGLIEFHYFFDKRYGLPFEGVLIEW